MSNPAFDLEAAQQRLANIYSAGTFELAGNVWLRALVEHFQVLEGRQENVLNWCEPAANIAEATRTLETPSADAGDPSSWLDAFSTLLKTSLQRGQNLHHPRYIGHQVPASIPIAALFDAVGAATNQVMAIYEMGPWSTAVERAMIAKLGAEIGYPPESFAGLITNGGSLANLTALLTARNVAIPDVWRTGISTKSVLVVQQDVHYCVVRAAGILGLGTDQVIRVPVDDQRKMRVEQLDEILGRLRADGRTVIAAVAGACATPIGAFDPLDDVADVCEKHNVWMHVDAAHGGGALLSDRHRELVRGIHRADSMVWDAHKMMFVPALCALVFYKNRDHRYVAFEQDAPYLFDPSDPGIAAYDSGTQTVECTKRAAALGLWGIWSLFGRQIFTDLVDVTFAMAQEFHRKLSAASDFQPLHEPECNIQVFRYTPREARDWSETQLGEFQLRLRREVITHGKAYIVPSKLDGRGALRATIMNPCTTGDDLDDILEAIRECGASLLS